jgi:hypothetical protein
MYSIRNCFSWELRTSSCTLRNQYSTKLWKSHIERSLENSWYSCKYTKNWSRYFCLTPCQKSYTLYSNSILTTANKIDISQQNEILHYNSFCLHCDGHRRSNGRRQRGQQPRETSRLLDLYWWYSIVLWTVWLCLLSLLKWHKSVRLALCSAWQCERHPAVLSVLERLFLRPSRPYVSLVVCLLVTHLWSESIYSRQLAIR